MKDKAIALCRVSTAKQRTEGHSLVHQEQSVKAAEQELNAEIVKTWSLDTSSKAGLNLKRKDLEEIRQYCKQHKGIKYLFVDRVSRLMREAKRFIWYIVELEDLGVTTYFTAPDQRHLNSDDQMALLSKFFNAVQAEQENKEKAQVNKDKMKDRIRLGYYPFNTHLGYIKSEIPGLHVPDPIRFNLLQLAFQEVAQGLYTPSQALKRMHEAGFTTLSGSKLKIDKFLDRLADEYYAGVLEVKSFGVINESGLHQSLITMQEYLAIQEVLGNHSKRKFHRKQYNPEFPATKFLLCGECHKEAKFTGSFQSNGKGNRYARYRCRGCGKQYLRKDVTEAVTNHVDRVEFDEDFINDMGGALREVWLERRKGSLQQVSGLRLQQTALEQTKSKLVISHATADDSLKPDIAIEIDKIKGSIAELTSSIHKLENEDDDFPEFAEFVINFIAKLKENWWSVQPEYRSMCQQMLFPGGIYYNSSKKVSTPQVSTIFRLAATKKTIGIDRKSLLVELEGIAPSSASSRHYSPTDLDHSGWPQTLRYRARLPMCSRSDRNERM